MKFVIGIKMLFVNFFYWVGVWISYESEREYWRNRINRISKVIKIIKSCETTENYKITERCFEQLRRTYPDMKLSKWGEQSLSKGIITNEQS